MLLKLQLKYLDSFFSDLSAQGMLFAFGGIAVTFIMSYKNISHVSMFVIHVASLLHCVLQRSCSENISNVSHMYIILNNMSMNFCFIPDC